MHLGRFHAVIDDLAKHFKRADLPAKLEQCASHLDQIAAAKSQPQVDAFRGAVEALLKASELNDPALQQPYAQQVIADLGLLSVLPPQFAAAVTKTIEDRSFDPTGLASELRQVAGTAARRINQVVSIDTAFTGLQIEYERVDGQSAEVGFLLPREAVGTTLKALTTEFNQLGKLARAINELVGAQDYDPRVVTISSSWWQVFLDLEPAQILVWVVTIERIVSLFKSNLEIKDLQRRLSDKAMPKEITDLIEQEVNRRVSSALDSLASDLKRDHAKVADEARLNEIEIQLRQGLVYLARRVNQGAQVEINVAVPDEPSEPDPGPNAEEGAPQVLSQEIAASRERIAALRGLRDRARSASTETLAIDKSAPLLLEGDVPVEDGIDVARKGDT